MTKADRIACCVPFCRCTVARAKFPNATEVICAKHWRIVPPALKRQRRSWERVARKMLLSSHPYAEKAWNRAGHGWDLCKAKAIEISAGITT